MDWNFEWITTWEGIREPGFRTWWRRLYESDTNATVFASPDLAWAWIEARGAERACKPQFLVGRTEGVEALLPLLLRRGRWQDAFPRILQPLGYNDFDYHDPLFSSPVIPEPLVASFWRGVIAEVDRAHHGAADVLEIRRLHDNACPGAVPSGQAAFISLKSFADGESLLAALSQSRRKDLRRQRRRLGEQGPVRLVVASDTDSALAWLPSFLQSYQARWGSKGKPYGKQYGFYEPFFRKCFPLGLVHVSSLEVGQQAISWDMGFVDPRRFCWYRSAFAEEWANYSPGKVHLFMLLEWAIAHGLTTFDFLHGDQSYKWTWTQSSEALYRLRHRIHGVRSRAVAGIRGFMRAVGRRRTAGMQKGHGKRPCR